MDDGRITIHKGLVLSGMAELPLTLLTDGSLSHIELKEIWEIGAIANSDNGPEFEERLASG